ncbi:hypothetical protein BH10ACI4_BH10ACI4_34650 [soil metagenome]
MSDTNLYEAGQKSCENCGDAFEVAVETWKGHTHLYCKKSACEEAARARHNGLYVGRYTIRCKSAKCDRFIPEGSYGRRTKHFVCSVSCWHSLRYQLFGVSVAFECLWCGKPSFGQIPPGKIGPRFCSIDCAGHFRHEENLKTSGVFRPLLDAYVATAVVDRYRGKSIPTHTQAVVKFLRFLSESGIRSLEKVGPLTISDYSKWGRENGSPNLLSDSSHVKAFFDWQLTTGQRQAANPVISSVHRKRYPKRKPRPYDDQTLEFIWDLLRKRGNSRLRAEAAIAEETGMRLGEIANIRISDVDLIRQAIFVRVPNKTNTERTAHFHTKSAEFISDWLQDRRTDCDHDYLFQHRRRPLS